MGGPCFLIGPEGKLTHAPPCTDNFQIKNFEFEGEKYYSCEHAYQANKFLPDGQGRRNMHMTNKQLIPKENESDSNHGMRCWSQGQRFACEVRPDWARVKVKVMLDVNRAKFRQHPDLSKELISTGSVQIVGAPSTSWTWKGIEYNWSQFNGLIQMIVREEARGDVGSPELLKKLLATIDAYDGSSSE